MKQDLFTGKLVRLTATEADKDSKAFIEWCRDSEYMRLQGSEPAQFFTLMGEQEWLENAAQNSYSFMIRSLADDRVIGGLVIDGVDPVSHDSWIGIGIGDRDYWGKGYGSEAMWLVMRYGFEYLNVHRISLTVFEYNPRAIRSYQKLGFKEEGRYRQWLERGGRRWDMIFMAILHDEWKALEKPI